MVSAASVAALTKPALDVLPTPVGATLLVELEVLPEKTKGGIIIVEQARTNDAYLATRGIVIAMGPDCYQGADGAFPNGAYCEVGHVVFFQKNAGLQLNANGKEYRLMRDTAVLGRIDAI